MKKLFLAAAAVAGAVLVNKKMKEQKAEQKLWQEATSSQPAPSTPASPASTPPSGS